MRLQDPYTGAYIEAAECEVERLIAHGYKKPAAVKKPEKPKETKRKKA